jgi:diacylglycerol kinase (ATP)
MTINKPNGNGLLRIKNASLCSLKGFQAAFKYESAFRQELFLCAILLPISLFVATDFGTWVMLMVSMLFLLFTEILNSALEALADRITTEHSELIGRAKDMGSACVFIALTILILVWVYAIWLKLGW